MPGFPPNPLGYASGMAPPIDTPPDDPGPDASITVYEDGPLIVRGPFALRAMDGTAIEPGRAAVALCRCGYSAIKPFCDGSHRRAQFAAPGGDERPSRADAQLRVAPALEEGTTGGGVQGEAAAGAPEHV